MNEHHTTHYDEPATSIYPPPSPVLVISTFENLSPRLTFLHCSEERVFSWCEKKVILSEEHKEEKPEQEDELEGGEDSIDEEEFLEKISTRRRGVAETESESSDDGPDIEILSMQIRDNSVSIL